MNFSTFQKITSRQYLLSSIQTAQKPHLLLSLGQEATKAELLLPRRSHWPEFDPK